MSKIWRRFRCTRAVCRVGRDINWCMKSDESCCVVEHTNFHLPTTASHVPQKRRALCVRLLLVIVHRRKRHAGTLLFAPASNPERAQNKDTHEKTRKATREIQKSSFAGAKNGRQLAAALHQVAKYSYNQQPSSPPGHGEAHVM